MAEDQISLLFSAQALGPAKTSADCMQKGLQRCSKAGCQDRSLQAEPSKVQRCIRQQNPHTSGHMQEELQPRCASGAALPANSLLQQC